MTPDMDAGDLWWVILLWIAFAVLWTVSMMGLYVLRVTMKERAQQRRIRNALTDRDRVGTGYEGSRRP